MVDNNATSSMMKFRFMFGFVVLLLMNHFQCYKAGGSDNTDELPSPNCKSYECPSYVTIHKDEAEDFQIRRYNHTVWISTSYIISTSFKEATRDGFLKLFDYVKGNNKEQQKVPMTAPVLTDVFLSNGSLPCQNSSFIVRLSMPTSFQDNPPAAMDDKGLHARRQKVRCAAVRAFGGFTSDQNIIAEAKSLEASLLNTTWGPLLKRPPPTRNNYTSKCLSKESPSVFSVAQYNNPFENGTRVNEIWFTLPKSKAFPCLSKPQ